MKEGLEVVFHRFFSVKATDLYAGKQKHLIYFIKTA
jgi:hypothetical protein